MIKQLTIENLGPFAGEQVIDLDADGVTELERPSEWGKSTIALAICVALWGCDTTGNPIGVGHIHQGADHLSVSMLTKRGAVIARTITAKRKHSRTIQPPGDAPLEYRKEDDFADALKRLGWAVDVGKKVHVARLVLVPMAWRALLTTGKGRPLRDFFAATLPMGSIRQHVADLMDVSGHTLTDDDPTDARTAESMRTRANREVDRAEGEHTGAARALDNHGGGAPVPDKQEVHDAKQAVRIEQAWLDHDQAAAPWRAAKQAASQWTERKQRIGSIPEGWSAEEYSRLDVDVDAAAGRVGLRREELRKANQKQGAARHQDEQANRAVLAKQGEIEAATERGDDCPTCGKKWAAAAKARKALSAELKTLTKALTVTTEGLASANSAVDEAMAKAREADKKVVEAQDKRAKLAAGARIRDQLAGLGEVPSVPAKPTPPKWKRPTAEALAEARQLITMADRAGGAVDEMKRARSMLKDEVAKSAKRMDMAQAEASRLEALVAAVRAAPSLALVDALKPLNSRGLSVRLSDKGGCAVDIDGRPWDMASTGRAVAADSVFRCILRNLLKLGPVPVAIDNVQDWTGWLPGDSGPRVNGPIIKLRTVKGVGASEII